LFHDPAKIKALDSTIIIEPVNNEFPVFQTHSYISKSLSDNSFLGYEEKMDSSIDAYYTILAPLLIIFVAASAENFFYAAKIPKFSIMIGIIYYAVSSMLQQTYIEELIFDAKREVFIRQHVTLKHDKKTPRIIDEEISFDQIESIQLLSCPFDIEAKKVGFELNLILKDNTRVNIFTHQDATINIEAHSISHLTSKPLNNYLCSLQ